MLLVLVCVACGCVYVCVLKNNMFDDLGEGINMPFRMFG